MVLAHPGDGDSCCRDSVPLPTCTHVCSGTEHWWHLKMKLPRKNLIHMSILGTWLPWRRLSQEHSAVFLWIQWHYFQAFKMHLGVMLCLVLLAYRCKYFKVFTGARKVTTWKLAGSCSPPAKTSLMPKSPSVGEWDNEGPGEDHMCERWPVRLHHSSSEDHPADRDLGSAEMMPSVWTALGWVGVELIL